MRRVLVLSRLVFMMGVSLYVSAAFPAEQEPASDPGQQEPVQQPGQAPCAKVCPKYVLSYHLDSSGNIAFATYAAVCCPSTNTYYDGAPGIVVPKNCTTDECLTTTIPVPSIDNVTVNDRHVHPAHAANGLSGVVASSVAAMPGTVVEEKGVVQLLKGGTVVTAKVYWVTNADYSLATGVGYEITTPNPMPVPLDVTTDKKVNGSTYCRYVRASYMFGESHDYLVLLVK